MQKTLRALAIVAVASQMIVPAYAADLINPSSMSGWRRQGEGAVMAYFRMPFGGGTSSAAQPRAGLKVVAPRSYGPSEIPMHVNNPALLDISFTARSLRSPWTATLNVGSTTTWASNPDALSPAARTHLFDGSDLSWPVVIAASVGIGIGIFAITEASK